MLGNDILSSADIFQHNLFQDILSRIPSERQTAWIQIRPNVLLYLICVQIKLFANIKMTKLAASRQREKPLEKYTVSHFSNAPLIKCKITQEKNMLFLF